MSIEGTVTVPRGLRKYRVTITENGVSVEKKKRMHRFGSGYEDRGRYRPVTVEPIDKSTALVVHEAIEELLRRSSKEDTGERHE